MTNAHVTIEHTDHWTPDMKWRYTVRISEPFTAYGKGFACSKSGAIRKAKRRAKKMARRGFSQQSRNEFFTIEIRGGL